MTLSNALASATSGLRATSRAADLVSGNVANALTPGYARRDLALATDVVGTGGGVRVLGVERQVDPIILADRRVAEAETGAARARADALSAIETEIGDPTSAGSLSDRVARFSASLVEAAGAPDREAQLDRAVADAKRLAAGFRSIGDAIQDTRSRADEAIAGMVERINTAVGQVDVLNDRIRSLGAGAPEAPALEERRQQIVDSVAELVPLREVARPDGTIALFTSGGAALLDGRAWPLGFEPRSTVTVGMTVEDGALSGLTLRGQTVPTGATRSLLGDGALQAQFDMRDRAGPEAQAALDALARDLVERTQDPTLDPSLPSGPPAAPGLFTDAGAAFDAGLPGAEAGLAQRLAVNAAVDPA
ncbi:MAG: flagellar hook-associated protein FlgK, partial [Deinococcus-Thermus bacterium]|nr:flagellar hook-associated protein FlgK [Deinococcota bacterium]